MSMLVHHWSLTPVSGSRYYLFLRLVDHSLSISDQAGDARMELWLDHSLEVRMWVSNTSTLTDQSPRHQDQTYRVTAFDSIVVIVEPEISWLDWKMWVASFSNSTRNVDCIGQGGLLIWLLPVSWAVSHTLPSSLLFLSQKNVPRNSLLRSVLPSVLSPLLVLVDIRRSGFPSIISAKAKRRSRPMPLLEPAVMNSMMVKLAPPRARRGKGASNCHVKKISCLVGCT